MVDEFTQQSVATGKAVAEVATDLIKLLSAALEKKVTELENSVFQNKPEKNSQIKSAEKQTDIFLSGNSGTAEKETAKNPNKEIADAFEDKLNNQGMNYERLSDDKFVVSAANQDMIKNVVRETAKDISAQKLQDQNIAANIMEEKLQKSGIDYERVNNSQFKLPEKDKAKAQNIAKDARNEAVQKRTIQKEPFKEKLGRNKQKAEQKNKNRRKNKTVQKSLSGIKPDRGIARG